MPLSKGSVSSETKSIKEKLRRHILRKCCGTELENWVCSWRLLVLFSESVHIAIIKRFISCSLQCLRANAAIAWQACGETIQAPDSFDTISMFFESQEILLAHSSVSKKACHNTNIFSTVSELLVVLFHDYQLPWCKSSCSTRQTWPPSRKLLPRAYTVESASEPFLFPRYFCLGQIDLTCMG